MSWRVARSLEQFFAELNAAAPKRSKASDGTIGDAAHASRSSDHNPWVRDGRGEGIVTAADFTDDDADGADMAKIVTYLTTVSRDPRVKYLIHNRRIYSSYPTSSAPAWAARPYSGINAHVHHLHVSVNPEPYHYDDADSWGIAEALAPAKPKPAPGSVPAPASRAPRFPLPDGWYFGEKEGPRESVSGYYSHASDLRLWQAQMRRRGWTLGVTGRFDAATQRVVVAFQREKDLNVTGHIHPATWAAAWTAPVTK